MAAAATPPTEQRQNDGLILHRLGKMDDKLDEVLREQRDQGKQLNNVATRQAVLEESLTNTQRDVDNLENKSDTWDKIVGAVAIIGAAISSAFGLGK